MNIQKRVEIKLNTMYTINNITFKIITEDDHFLLVVFDDESATGIFNGDELKIYDDCENYKLNGIWLVFAGNEKNTFDDLEDTFDIFAKFAKFSK